MVGKRLKSFYKLIKPIRLRLLFVLAFPIIIIEFLFALGILFKRWVLKITYSEFNV
jgi:hypothetical protein